MTALMMTGAMTGLHNMYSIKLKFSKPCESLEGQSKWWGAPDLPAGSPYPVVHCAEEGDEWDETLTFLCQIRCEDIAALDHDGLLPHGGMLYFFAAVDYFLGMDSPLYTPIGPWRSENVRVMYSPSCEGLQPYEMHWEDTGESVFRPAEKLEFESCGACDEGFKLLGRPYMIDVNEEYDDDYVSLLQVDENDAWGLHFYDCGMLFLLIRRSQLLGRDWEKTSACLHSY